jgi:hypothetical protein
MQYYGPLYVLAADRSGRNVAAPFSSFLALLILDIASHWCQNVLSLSVGAHHKE